MTSLSKRQVQIIKLLMKDGRMKLKSIGSKLGISHTAVKKHLEAMRRKGVLKISPLLNPEKLGLVMAVLLLEIDRIENIEEVAERFRECPRLVLLSRALGPYNMIGLVVAEDYRVLDILLGECMLRVSEGIRRSEVMPLTTIYQPSHIQIKVPEKIRPRAPCGADCCNCNYFLKEACPGCPATSCYRGWLSPV